MFHHVTGDWTGPIIATAIHAGHALRAEVAAEVVLDEEIRRREEDPFTDRMIAGLPARLTVGTSRFEVDLNRSRDKAVYRVPADCWGLKVWRSVPLPTTLVSGSLAAYDAFYADLANRLDAVAARGPFVVYDVHSYNHRRRGPAAPPEPPEQNPVVNVGTGTLDRDRFGGVVAPFSDAVRAAFEGEDLDVRENVRFTGGHLSSWVDRRYAGVGCALAIEFKKMFMDEWTGVPDEVRLGQIADALVATQEGVRTALDAIR